MSLFDAYASVVRLAKIVRSKTPETVDAVGVQPTASKLFGSFGAAGGIRTHGTIAGTPDFELFGLL